MVVGPKYDNFPLVFPNVSRAPRAASKQVETLDPMDAWRKVERCQCDISRPMRGREFDTAETF